MDILLTRLVEHLDEYEATKKLNEARKASECICKILLVNGGQSSDIYTDKYGEGLINLLNTERTKIEKNHLTKIKNFLTLIKTYGSNDSHDSDYEVSENDYEVVARNLDEVLKLILSDKNVEFDFALPDSLCLKYRSVIVSEENWHCEKILSLVYPNRSYEFLAKKSGYEFYCVKDHQSVQIGFLILGRNVSFKGVFDEVVTYCDTYDFATLIILFPNEISLQTQKPVQNRKENIEKAAQILKNKIKTLYFEFIETYIWNQCLPNSYKTESNITSEPYYVDQLLFVHDNHDKNINSQNFIINITKDVAPFKDMPDKKPIYLITGAGGVGKTTFCEEALKQIDALTKEGLRKKAILLASYNLPDDIPNNLEISSIQDLFFLIKQQDQSLNTPGLELNISSGNLIIIIDGLDEIISKFKERFKFKSFIQSVLLLNETYMNCNLIITARGLTYSLDDYEIIGIEKLILKGFDENLAQKYFEKRFNDSTEKDKFKKIALEHLKKINRNTETTPLVLKLISELVVDDYSNNTSITNDSQYFIKDNPLDNIIYQIIDREIFKQSLEISCDTYFEVVNEIVVSNNGRITEEVFKNNVEILVSEAAAKFEAFSISPLLSKSDKYFYIKYDSLEQWFKVRTVCNLLSKANLNLNIGTLEKLKLLIGSNEVIEETSALHYDTILLKENIKKILSYIITGDYKEDPQRKIISALLNISTRILKVSEKQEVSRLIVELFPSKNNRILGVSIYGSFVPISFEDIVLENAFFNGYTNLAKSKFPKNKTVFYKSSFSNFSDIKFPKEQFGATTFDKECILDGSLNEAIQLGTTTEAKKVTYITDDLRKILKCGFANGSFGWKSEGVYKQQCNTLKTDISLKKWLTILEANGFLLPEKSNTKLELGYRIPENYQVQIKDFVTQKISSPNIKNLIRMVILPKNN